MPPPSPDRRAALDRRLTDLLDRIETARRDLADGGDALAAAGRTADAAGMAAAAARTEAAAAALRAAGADRTRLLTEHSAATLADLAADSRLTHTARRIGSLRESFGESRTHSWGRWVAAKRSAAAFGEVLDLIARGGARAATYSSGAGHPAGERPVGGALLNIAG